ncbi:MAG: hypothetical protein U1E05_27235, partial [Patescibacteria group bacterium]|nr:hypothetical protein [Patescibacteria group bacterium]
MKRYRMIGSICLAATLVLGTGLVARGVDISGTYTMSTTLANGDTWTGGNVTINGVTVTVPTGATVTFDSTVGRYLYGTSPGVLLVDTGGTLRVATTTSNDNLVIAAPVKFDNRGILEFASGGDLQLNHSGAVFENTGLIYKKTGTLGTSDDPSFIFRSTAATGLFFNNGGSIQVDAGTLEILGGRSNGGTFTTNGGRLQLSDYWTEFRGTAVGAPVYINSSTGTSGYKFVAAAATTVVDVKGQGLRWDGRDIDTNGNVLQNDGLFSINLAGTGNLFGGGTFRNSASGTLDVQRGTISLAGGTAFENEGTMTFTTADTKTFQGTGTVLNKAGATADWRDGTINLNAATVVLKNEGTFNLTTAATKILSGTGTFENAAGATMNWQAGAGDLTLNGNLTNNGTFVYYNGDRNINGAGHFINNGTFIHAASGADNITGTGSGRFVNNGVFDFAEEGDFQLKANYTFVNNGTLRKTAGTASDSLFFNWGSGTGTGGTFNNPGTVEVLVGGLAVYKAGSGIDGIIVPQYNAATKALTGGTWIVRWTSGVSSKLDLQPADAGIQIIGAGAAVELSGTNSLFPQLTGHVTEVAGTLTINNRTFSAAAFGSGVITLTG